MFAWANSAANESVPCCANGSGPAAVDFLLDTLAAAGDLAAAAAL